MHTTAKVSQGTNRNTLVQLSAMYSHRAQRYRQTDKRMTWFE